MAAYLISTYDVTDPETYAKYNPGSMGVIMKTITKHGGEVIAAGHDAIQLSGDVKAVKIVLKFPTAEAAQAWHDDPEYAEAKALRLSATTNIDGFIINEFVPPGA